jgi:hypothetical protein
MNDPKFPRPTPRPGVTPAPRSAVPAARESAPAGPAARTGGDGATGKVVHDDRGNAVWDWMKHTSRVCIESTSRLLRKLELPELKFEDPKDEELRIMPDPSTGGGYDPYNQADKPSRKTLKK